MPTAVLVVIGNEILSGKFQDENSPWLARRCRELGINLRQIVVIPDEVDVIASVVAEASAAHDYVFTSGGVGPTHDDLTMEGVSVGLARPLQRHPSLEQTLRDRMGETITEAALTMADVPSGAELWVEDAMFFPQVVVGNVLVFPGVPRLFRLKFDAIAHRLGHGATVHSVQVVTAEAETAIAGRLRQLQADFPAVEIGSYPQFDTRPYTVTVTIDGVDADEVHRCKAHLETVLELHSS